MSQIVSADDVVATKQNLEASVYISKLPLNYYRGIVFLTPVVMAAFVYYDMYSFKWLIYVIVACIVATVGSFEYKKPYWVHLDQSDPIMMPSISNADLNLIQQPTSVESLVQETVYFWGSRKIRHCGAYAIALKDGRTLIVK